MNFLELKVELLRKGLTLADLAKHLNISMASMYSKINGRTPFKQIEISKISEYLNLDPKKIFNIFFN